jgi:DNA-directed RNA polymerase subunit RPC12/RpoP
MSRKYRHQGYQDSDRHDDRPKDRPPQHRTLTTEERIQRKSLRHAIDREAREVVRCHTCGRGIQGLEVTASDTTCPYCSSPLHCCRGCRHFDSGARWQCRAQITAAVSDKNKANDCEQYAPRMVLDSTGRRSDTPRGAGGPREQFENLFKR